MRPPSDTEKPARRPGRTPEGQAREDERKARAAKALRENLKRRKRQISAREAGPENTAEEPE